MPKTRTTDLVCSKPTMCLGCHLIVTMTHAANADPIKGSWECPRCGHEYPFAFWKIKKQTRDDKKVAA